MTERPDQVETDPAALNSAEDLDEDELHVDPLEKGMDPPEHWSAADRRGMTGWEQAHPAPLDERLAEEEPDDDAVPAPADENPVDHPTYDETQGTSADVAGGSIADEIRKPPPPE